MRRSIVYPSLAVVGMLALSGCSAGAEAAPKPTQTSAVGTTDTATCSGFSDVLTIAANADAGLRDGRMAAQEQEGWYRLATRVLNGVPTRGEGAVSDAVGTLKTVAPLIGPGAMGTTGIGSAEWDSGVQDLSAACTESGAEIAVERFTGG
jgi:hypothetical protein